MSAHPILRRFLPALACLILVAPLARADAIYTHRTKIRGSGDLGRMEIVRTVRISGEKEREESTVKFSGSAARDEAAKPVDTTSIIRLDRGNVLSLEPSERSFTERSILDERAYLQRLAAEADTSTDCMEAPGMAPIVSVKASSDQRKVGAWDAQLTTIAARTEVIDLKTGLHRSAEVVLDLWMAADVPGQDEVRTFDSVRAAHLDLASETFPTLQGLAGGYQRSMEKVRDAYRNLPGFPVQWTLTIRTDLSAEDRAALADAAKLEEEGADPSQKEQQTADAANLADPLAGVTSRSPESARDKTPPHPLEPAAGEYLSTTAADQEVDTGRGMTIVLQADSVLESAATAPDDPAQFEIPSGFTAAPAPPR